jgi:hypothetical protein
MKFPFLALGGVLGLVGATAHASNFPLYLQQEDVPTVNNYATSSNLFTLTVSQPVMCANTGPAAAGAPNGGLINPVFANFIFGPYSVAQNGAPVQTPSVGLTNVQYKTSLTPATYVLQADSTLGTPPLVCYVTDANGVRKPTSDIFVDNFDHDYTLGAAPDIYDSSVTVTVEARPPAGYALIYVDINIPTPAQQANFVLRDGYNTRVFNTTGGGWCQAANTIATTCPDTSPPTALTLGDINFTQTLNSNSSPTQMRFIVYRQYKTLNNTPISPNPGELLALAALFSPSNIAEVPLGNNVAAVVAPIPQ